MPGLFALLRDILLLGVLAVFIVAASTTLSRDIVLTPPPVTVATSTPGTRPNLPAVAEVSTSSTPLSPRVTDAPKKPATTTPPAAKPVVKPVASSTEPRKPKVEDLNLTVQDAITSITSLAQGQSSTSQSLNDRVRAALVNIICTTQTSGPFSSVSGSGIVIDPRGVILTNAHVAQFFLLKDYPVKNFVSCIIRTGSPAYPAYTAELMFLPPTWVKDNAYKITQDAPTGTGERDYALLRITGAVSSTATLPSQFPFLLVAVNPPDIGTDVLQAGYAAGFLGGISIQNNLYASSAWTKVRDVFTFNANTIDLLALGGSIVAQGGSSGGPVVNTDGTVVGVIVTNSGTGDTATRDLHALTSAYIVRDFENERGKSLSQMLSNDLSSEVDIFNRVYFPSQKQALVNELEK